MQFSSVLNIFIVKTKLNSTFTNDLKRKEFFSKNVHSYRVCSFNIYLSYEVASGSEITPCNKVDKPLVVYRFTGNGLTSIATLRT